MQPGPAPAQQAPQPPVQQQQPLQQAPYVAAPGLQQQALLGAAQPQPLTPTAAPAMPPPAAAGPGPATPAAPGSMPPPPHPAHPPHVSPAAAAMRHGPPPVPLRAKKRKLPADKPGAADKSLPAIPESGLYNYLLDMDRLVTDTINRRRADFKEPFPPYHEPVKRTLRLVVQATYANQPAPPPPPPPPPPPALPGHNAAALAAASAAMFNHQPPAANGQPPAEPPSWILTLSGSLTDPTEPLVRAALAAAMAAASRGDPSSQQLLLQAQALAAQHAAQQAAAAAVPAAQRTGLLTGCVRRIEVLLDPRQYPGEEGRVVWDKAAHTGPQREVLEVRRTGSRPLAATILVYPDYQPERYVVPPALASVLGMTGHESRSRVMVALYGFIKSRRLQDPRSPIVVNLSPDLQAVFGTPTLRLSDLGSRLSSLLLPVPPVRIDFEIRPDGPSPSDAVLYDVDFFTPSPHPHAMGNVLQSYYKDKEIDAMDAKLAGLIRRLNEARRRRALLLGFAQAPIDTTHALLAAQARELRQGRAGSGRDYEAERRSEVFRQRWAEEAVVSYLHKRDGPPMVMLT